jgi:hypothetical protein
VRAGVEHPFRLIKRQFGRVKVRFRGLTKNTAQPSHCSSCRSYVRPVGNCLPMQVRYVCKTQKPVKAGFLLQSIAEGRAKSDSVADRLPVADLCGVSLATRRITEGLSPKADSWVQRLMYAGGRPWHHIQLGCSRLPNIIYW